MTPAYPLVLPLSRWVAAGHDLGRVVTSRPKPKPLSIRVDNIGINSSRYSSGISKGGDSSSL